MATILKNSLQRFYRDPRHAEVLEAIATSRTDISLRLVEWYVANDRVTNMEYHVQLKAYTRRYFDPFRRSERIVFTDYADHSFETTWGQMNFFKWFIEEGHWDRLREARVSMHAEMFAAMKSRRDAPKGSAGASEDPPDRAAPRKHVTREKTVAFD